MTSSSQPQAPPSDVSSNHSMVGSGSGTPVSSVSEPLKQAIEGGSKQPQQQLPGTQQQATATYKPDDAAPTNMSSHRFHDPAPTDGLPRGFGAVMPTAAGGGSGTA